MQQMTMFGLNQPKKEDAALNVLSLFDGMSCGMVALERAGIKVNKYYASEIDKYAIQVSKDNYPDIIQLGDVKGWGEWDLPKIDLLIGGSPCQGFSFAEKKLNFEDERSKLFFEFVKVLKHIKPKYFLLENVNMKESSRNVISEYLSVEPIRINSNLLSAQNRDRFYWTNIPDVTLPDNKNINVQSILESGQYVGAMRGRYLNGNSGPTAQFIECRNDNKSNGLTTVAKDNVVLYDAVEGKTLARYVKYRYLTPLECERLQTLPEGYTKCVSDRQRIKMIGNGWTVSVIAHILGGLK